MAENTAPVPSHIQERLRLERAEHNWMYQLIIPAVLALGWTVVVIIDGGTRPWPWVAAAIFTVLAIISAFALRRARRATRAFEREHGAGAGVQKPV